MHSWSLASITNEQNMLKKNYMQLLLF